MGELRQLKPGLWHPGRRINWWLVAILVGVLIVWTILVAAVIRVMT